MCKCLNCGKELEGWQKKYCSVSCQNSFRGKKVREEYYLLPKHCENCGKEIPFEHRFNRFCSHSCAAKVNNTKREGMTEEQKKKISETLKRKCKKNERICMVCGEKYYKTLTPGSTKKFCSKGCRQYYKEHRKEFLSEETINKLSLGGRKSAYVQNEIRRSKNEIYFCELCKKHFNDVKHNERIFNGWDADVIVEDVRCAILWNGAWHYKEIGKGYPLEMIQNRDKIKVGEIEKCGYIPYIIKDMGSENRKFVEEEFEKFLKHIAGC